MKVFCLLLCLGIIVSCQGAGPPKKVAAATSNSNEGIRDGKKVELKMMVDTIKPDNKNRNIPVVENIQHKKIHTKAPIRLKKEEQAWRRGKKFKSTGPTIEQKNVQNILNRREGKKVELKKVSNSEMMNTNQMNRKGKKIYPSKAILAKNTGKNIGHKVLGAMKRKGKNVQINPKQGQHFKKARHGKKVELQNPSATTNTKKVNKNNRKIMKQEKGKGNNVAPSIQRMGKKIELVNPNLEVNKNKKTNLSVKRKGKKIETQAKASKNRNDKPTVVTTKKLTRPKTLNNKKRMGKNLAHKKKKENIPAKRHGRSYKQHQNLKMKAKPNNRVKITKLKLQPQNIRKGKKLKTKHEIRGNNANKKRRGKSLKGNPLKYKKNIRRNLKKKQPKKSILRRKGRALIKGDHIMCYDLRTSQCRNPAIKHMCPNFCNKFETVVQGLDGLAEQAKDNPEVAADLIEDLAGFITNDDICQLPADIGHCFRQLPRFYFSSKSGKCEEFIYNGCKGNANNFKTIQECINRCDKSGKPKHTLDKCMMFCPRSLFPVCGTTGSDDKTFPNKCIFQREQCRNPSLQLRHVGPCKTTAHHEERPLIHVPSMESSLWFPRDIAKPGLKLDKCEKPCPRSYLPVCGSDGKTYNNKCIFQNEQCTNPILQLSYLGRCKTSTKSGPKLDNCEKPCPRSYLPVCGSDGKTYNNKCIFQNEQCTNPILKLSYLGRCKTSNPGGVTYVEEDEGIFKVREPKDRDPGFGYALDLRPSMPANFPSMRPFGTSRPPPFFSWPQTLGLRGILSPWSKPYDGRDDLLGPPIMPSGLKLMLSKLLSTNEAKRGLAGFSESIYRSADLMPNAEQRKYRMAAIDFLARLRKFIGVKTDSCLYLPYGSVECMKDYRIPGSKFTGQMMPLLPKPGQMMPMIPKPGQMMPLLHKPSSDHTASNIDDELDDYDYDYYDLDEYEYDGGTGDDNESKDKEHVLNGVQDWLSATDTIEKEMQTLSSLTEAVGRDMESLQTLTSAIESAAEVDSQELGDSDTSSYYVTSDDYSPSADHSLLADYSPSADNTLSVDHSPSADYNPSIDDKLLADYVPSADYIPTNDYINSADYIPSSADNNPADEYISSDNNMVTPDYNSVDADYIDAIDDYAVPDYTASLGNTPLANYVDSTNYNNLPDNNLLADNSPSENYVSSSVNLATHNDVTDSNLIDDNQSKDYSPSVDYKNTVDYNNVEANNMLGSNTASASEYMDGYDTLDSSNLMPDFDTSGNYISTDGSIPSDDSSHSADSSLSAKYVLSSDYSPSADYVPSADYSPTADYSHSADYMPSADYNPSADYSPSADYIPSNDYISATDNIPLADYSLLAFYDSPSDYTSSVDPDPRADYLSEADYRNIPDYVLSHNAEPLAVDYSSSSNSQSLNDYSLYNDYSPLADNSLDNIPLSDEPSNIHAPTQMDTSVQSAEYVPISDHQLFSDGVVTNDYSPVADNSPSAEYYPLADNVISADYIPVDDTGSLDGNYFDYSQYADTLSEKVTSNNIPLTEVPGQVNAIDSQYQDPLNDPTEVSGVEDPEAANLNDYYQSYIDDPLLQELAVTSYYGTVNDYNNNYNEYATEQPASYDNYNAASSNLIDPAEVHYIQLSNGQY